MRGDPRAVESVDVVVLGVIAGWLGPTVAGLAVVGVIVLLILKRKKD